MIILFGVNPSYLNAFFLHQLLKLAFKFISVIYDNIGYGCEIYLFFILV